MTKLKETLINNNKLFGCLLIMLSSLSLILSLILKFNMLSLLLVLIELVICVLAIVVDNKIHNIKAKILLFLVLIVGCTILRVIRGNFILFLFYFVHYLIVLYCFVEGYRLFNYTPMSELFLDLLNKKHKDNNTSDVDNVKEEIIEKDENIEHIIEHTDNSEYIENIKEDVDISIKEDVNISPDTSHQTDNSFDNSAYTSQGLSDEEFDSIIDDTPDKMEIKPLYEKDLHPHKKEFKLPKID